MDALPSSFIPSSFVISELPFSTTKSLANHNPFKVTLELFFTSTLEADCINGIVVSQLSKITSAFDFGEAVSSIVERIPIRIFDFPETVIVDPLLVASSVVAAIKPTSPPSTLTLSLPSTVLS